MAIITAGTGAFSGSFLTWICTNKEVYIWFKNIRYVIFHTFGKEDTNERDTNERDTNVKLQIAKSSSLETTIT